MIEDIESGVLSFFREPDSRAYFAQDANIASQLNILINKLKTFSLARFSAKALASAKKMLTYVQKEARAVVRRTFIDAGKEFAIPAPKMPKGMAEVLRASLEENASLIRNIQEDYISQITGDLMRLITTGDGNLARLTMVVSRCRKKALHRAENVALDQTRKAFQAVARNQLKSAGVTRAIWIHTGGTLHPRKAHKDFSGQEFDLDKGAPIGHYGGRTDAPTWPSFEPFCRCQCRPILDWDD